VYFVFDFCHSICYTFSVQETIFQNTTIQSRQNITIDLLHNYYKAKGIPVLITGMMTNWPALKKWSPQFFKDQYSEAEIGIQWGNPEQSKTFVRETSIRQFVDWIQEIEKDVSIKDKNASLHPRPYWAEESGIFQENPELIADMNYLPLLNTSETVKLDLFIWFGPPHTYTGLHIDRDPLNILHQIYGHKKFFLYPPDQTKYLYPSDKYDPGAILSQVDITNYDKEKLPLFAKAKPIEVVVNPGDMLFIPSGWMHSATSLSTSISVSGRALILCEYVAIQWVYALEWLHEIGLYKNGNCVCHNTKE